MNSFIKTLIAVTLLSAVSMAPAHAANTLTIDGTLLKNAGGTTFDAWKFKILGTGSFNVDVAAYEASQNNIATAGYYNSDINADGELTWLDSDTYFYHDSGTIKATDAIFRCDDVANNCNETSNYFNGYTPASSPLTRITRLQSETPIDGSVHFRRDAWYDVTVNTPGDYLFLMADFRLDPAEAAGGINANDSFSAPTGIVNPILDHADYKVTFSSTNMLFSINGNTITVSQVPVPGAVWLFGTAMAGIAGFARRKPILSA